jgi:hypothetical protein
LNHFHWILSSILILKSNFFSFDAAARDVSLFSLNLHESFAISRTSALLHFGSSELPAAMRPAGLRALPASDPDVRALNEAHRIADLVSSAVVTPGAVVPEALRVRASAQLRQLRNSMRERLQRDAHAHPSEMLAATAAESLDAAAIPALLPSPAQAALSPLAATMVRRRRFVTMIDELEAQVRPMPKQLAAAPAAALTGDLDGQEAEAEQIVALNRNARKPRAANNGKRPVVCLVSSALLAALHLSICFLFFPFNLPQSRMARRLKNPRRTKV